MTRDSLRLAIGNKVRDAESGTEKVSPRSSRRFSSSSSNSWAVSINRSISASSGSICSFSSDGSLSYLTSSRSSTSRLSELKLPASLFYSTIITGAMMTGGSTSIIYYPSTELLLLLLISIFSSSFSRLLGLNWKRIFSFASELNCRFDWSFCEENARG